MSGEIPPEIGMLTSLETVLLNNNLLTGSIPDEVQFLTTARTLALYQNNLEGTLEREVDGELFCPVCEMIGLERLQIGPIQGVGQVPFFCMFSSFQHRSAYCHLDLGVCPTQIRETP